MLDSTKIRREIMRLYDKEPQGWRVLVGKDTSGFYDLLISHGKDAWQLKEYLVNPYRVVGLGSKIPEVTSPPVVGHAYPFGLRPVSLNHMRELANLIDDPKAIAELATKILTEKPVGTREAFESSAILQGPVLHSMKPLDSLSTAHTRLDQKLRSELRRIVEKDFRHTVTPYL